MLSLSYPYKKIVWQKFQYHTGQTVSYCVKLWLGVKNSEFYVIICRARCDFNKDLTHFLRCHAFTCITAVCRMWQRVENQNTFYKGKHVAKWGKVEYCVSNWFQSHMCHHSLPHFSSYVFSYALPHVIMHVHMWHAPHFFVRVEVKNA